MILLRQALLFHACFLLFRVYLFLFFLISVQTLFVTELAPSTYFIIPDFGKQQQQQQDLYLCVLGYYVALLLSGDTT